jgi:hypothetical protein
LDNSLRLNTTVALYSQQIHPIYNAPFPQPLCQPKNLVDLT